MLLCNHYWGIITEMNTTEFQEMEQLNYIKSHSHLLSKLHLEELDHIVTITEMVRECIKIILELRIYTDKSSLLVENIKPVITQIELLQKKTLIVQNNLYNVSSIFDILNNISKSSQNLTDKLKFIQDINTGILGRKDYISNLDLEFENMYYFSEKNFEDLILNIYLLINRFENKGEAVTKKEEAGELISEINKLIEFVMYLADKCLPFTLFIRHPKIFEKCYFAGESIGKKLVLIHAAKKLLKFMPLLDEAIEGLEKLARKYKDKPNKKISLDAIVFRKDGADELGLFLRKTNALLKLI